MRRSGGQIVLLNGPSCSGKTTIARAIQARMPQPFLHVGLDHFEAMQPVKRGRRIHAFYGQCDDDGDDPPNWGADLVHVMHACIAEFAAAGANVVAEHILLEQAWRRDIAARLAEHDVLFVGVLCPLGELERRERSREGRDPSSGQAARQFHQLGPLAAPGPYGLVLNTAELDADECAIRVQTHLEAGVSRTALRRLAESMNPMA
jgi:chloramphenicol 3-O phosphotransferase